MDEIETRAIRLSRLSTRRACQIDSGFKSLYNISVIKRTRVKSTPTQKISNNSVATDLKSPKVNYKFKAVLNNKTTELETSDLSEAIMSIKPLTVKTRLLLNITREDGKTCEKNFPVKIAKMIFNQARYRDIFIKRLIFKQNVGV